MRRIAFGAVAIAPGLAGAASTSPARAAAPSEFLTRLMGGVREQGKTLVCFAGVYDEAHLSGHPNQNVTSAKATKRL